MRTNEQPVELAPPNQKNESWVIHYGKEVKSVTISGGPWMTFVNSCGTEAGNHSEVSKNVSNIIKMDFTFDKSHAALDALCPNAMGNEFTPVNVDSAACNGLSISLKQRLSNRKGPEVV